MALPLGEHGVVSIAVEERDAFDDEDVALVELLALSATGALDRLARERERRQFRRVVDQIDEMAFLMDADNRLTFVTESLAAYLGRDVETLRGSRLYDVVADEHVADCRARLTATRESAGTATQQIDLVGGDGESRPVEIELSAADEGMGREGGADQPAMAGVVTDISELEQTRDRLATERRRFRELFENLPDPVVEAELTDEGPIVRYANPAFTDVFGHGGAIQGADLDDLVVPAEECDRAERIDERVRDGEQVSVEVRRETRDGRRDFLLRGIPYSRTAHGDGSYAFAVYTDITEQKERERFRQVLNRVLRHNLRNDLTVVMGLADHLRGSVSDPALAERAGTLRDNAAEVASTSEKVRTIERITGRRAESDGTERVDAAGQLRAAVAGARRDHPGADITVDVPDELPVRATGDLQRAFAELVENAVEHADGTPRLRIDAATGVGHDDRTELRFHDHGPGIPDREWEIVAGEREITQLTHGTGLGLWLIRWIVEFCGGEIECRRREDGTTVVLSLRSADVDPDGDD
jgi:PAS domain S-box-containing protein